MRNPIHSKHTEHMPLRHWLEKKLAYEIDIQGIAVALALLVSVSVFAGGSDNGRGGEDQQSPSVSMQLAPTLNTEETGTLQDPDDEADLSDTSLRRSTSR